MWPFDKEKPTGGTLLIQDYCGECETLCPSDDMLVFAIQEHGKPMWIEDVNLLESPRAGEIIICKKCIPGSRYDRRKKGD